MHSTSPIGTCSHQIVLGCDAGCFCYEHNYHILKASYSLPYTKKRKKKQRMQCTVITCGGAVDMLTMWNAEHLLRKKKWQWIEDSWLFAQHSRTQSKSKQTPVTKTIRSRRIAVASVLLWLLILQLFSAESRGGRWLDCHWVLLMETSCTHSRTTDKTSTLCRWNILALVAAWRAVKPIQFLLIWFLSLSLRSISHLLVDADNELIWINNGLRGANVKKGLKCARPKSELLSFELQKK